MFENVNIDWNLSHDDGSTDFSDEETLDDHPRTLTRTPDKKGLRPMSIYTPVMSNGETNDDSPENNRSHGSSSDWSRSNTADSGDSPGSYRNSIMPPPPPPSQSKKPSICKWITSIPLSSVAPDRLLLASSFCLVAALRTRLQKSLFCPSALDRKHIPYYQRGETKGH